MKKILFTLILSAFFLLGYSQMQFGVQAGLSITNANRSVPGISLPGFSFGSSHISGLVAGISGSLPILKWLEFRPELNYVQRGTELTSSYVSFTPDGKYILNYLNLPMNIVYHHKLGPGKIFSGFGPEFALGLSGRFKGSNNRHINIKFDGESSYADDSLHLKPVDIGLSFCLGYQLNNGLFLNGGYFLGLTDIDANKDFDWKNHGFSIKIGYLFGKF